MPLLVQQWYHPASIKARSATTCSGGDEPGSISAHPCFIVFVVVSGLGNLTRACLDYWFWRPSIVQTDYDLVAFVFARGGRCESGSIGLVAFCVQPVSIQ